MVSKSLIQYIFHLLAFLNYPLCFAATLTDKKLVIMIIESKENEEC